MTVAGSSARAGSPRVILLAGVSGSGKSTVGRRLADALGAELVEADDLHSRANIARMRAGTPLDDRARAPWLRAVHRAAATSVRRGRPVVIACSALKARYREVLLAGFANTATILLQVDRATLDRRLRHRPHHFMPASLLDSQLRDLEPPDDAIVIDASGSVAGTMTAVLGSLGEPARGPERRGV